MSKRVYLILPNKVSEVLKRWVDEQGCLVVSLAAYLMEKAVKKANLESNTISLK